MNVYTLKFSMPYIVCDNYKEKELQHFIGIVNGSRAGLLLNGYIYGNISFDESDKKHDYPVISELESFSRSKTNAIIFNVRDPVTYNKLIIYQTLNKDNSFYGILGYNEETGKHVHIYNIEYDYTKIMIYLFRLLKK